MSKRFEIPGQNGQKFPNRQTVENGRTISTMVNMVKMVKMVKIVKNNCQMVKLSKTFKW